MVMGEYKSTFPGLSDVPQAIGISRLGILFRPKSVAGPASSFMPPKFFVQKLMEA